MKVALVHSFYRSALPSGENQALLDLREALTEAGHEVRLICRHSDDIGVTGALRAAVTVASGAGSSPLPALRAFQPDVVHVHNLFPNFGRLWARQWRGPLVVTLHNFRTLCAKGTLFRDGAGCTECPDGTAWQAVLHRCYRQSALATVPWSVSPHHGRRDPLLKSASRIIVLSRRSEAIFAEYGLPRQKMVVIPNGMPPLAPPAAATAPHRWIFLGRLDHGKGLRDLLHHWPEGSTLDVVGDGPLQAELQGGTPVGVSLLGARDRPWVRSNLPSYTGLVFPSRLLENSPLSVIEALSCGVPVAARAGSAAADAIAQIDPSWTYEGADPSGAMTAVTASGGQGRRQALEGYLRQHSPDVWIEAIERVYSEATGV